ncbi:MAG TPA: PilZ domain-containing protein [Geoalkalibacter subterraneus]|uniref:PilZ domain-containing protein n=1 Tax=Geoalkalibacter subterraneus TaxID=483547 RepID=A0A831LQU0_9BACT|nr:PilZ domain-containing protein [Geoalkalibacter subterraneus]
MLTKYLKPGRKIFIQPRVTPNEQNHIEKLSGHIRSCERDFVDLALPYNTAAGEHYPFTPEMPLNLTTEAYGMGVEVDGTFSEFRGPDLIRVHCLPDIRLYQRRVLPRIEVSIGLRYAKSKGQLRSLRSQWEKKLQILDRLDSSTPVTKFPYCPVNLSGGGIRLNFREETEIADLCLLLMELAPQQPPICTLAEIVWLRPTKPGWQTAGLRFTHIREKDQRRINRFVEQARRDQPQENTL